MLVEICEIFSQTYATLLNCWKFLKLYHTKLGRFNPISMALAFTVRGMVKIDRDVTMDNQQPRPNEFISH
jgi:hypothetical protein